MVKLQPSLPGMRKKKEGAEAPSVKKGGHEEKGQDRRLLWVIAAVVIIVVVLVILWAYASFQSPGPQNVITDSDVRAELAKLPGINSEPGKINPADYPKTLGIYWKNNLTLELKYYCSDVCPDYGRVDLVFQGVDNEMCAEIGGDSLHDLAWGGYIGCEPKIQG